MKKSKPIASKENHSKKYPLSKTAFQSIKKNVSALEKIVGQLQRSPADIKAELDKVKNTLDSLSELGETESLRLQMAMDRVGKFMTALSNIMKKMSDTSQAIIQNFK